MSDKLLTAHEVELAFEELSDHYQEFDEVDTPHHPRRDISALIALHKLVPGTRPMITAAEHDIIFFDCRTEQLVNVTKADVLTLVRHGVRLEDGYLSMYV